MWLLITEPTSSLERKKRTWVTRKSTPDRCLYVPFARCGTGQDKLNQYHHFQLTSLEQYPLLQCLAREEPRGIT